MNFWIEGFWAPGFWAENFWIGFDVGGGGSEGDTSLRSITNLRGIRQ